MMRPSRSSLAQRAVPGNGVTIANRGRSIFASTANRAVSRKTSGESSSSPKTYFLPFTSSGRLSRFMSSSIREIAFPLPIVFPFSPSSR